MKWFQHQTDSHDDEFLKELLHKYKARGLGVWWTTLEHVAKIVKVSPAPDTKEGYKVSARLEIAPSVLMEATGERLVTLVEILSFCAKRGKFTFKKAKELWVLEWPKILEFKDNATADLIAKYRRELGSELGSDLDVTSGLHTVLPRDNGNGNLNIGGPSESSRDEDRLFAIQVTRQLTKFIHSPSNMSITKSILDLLRQGVSRRLIAESPMMPEYRTMDFYDITRDLKKRSGETDGRTGSGGGRGGSAPLNPGAKAVLGHFALRPGELEEKTRQRIADRERRETETAAGGNAQDRRDGGDAPKVDEVPGPEKV